MSVQDEWANAQVVDSQASETWDDQSKPIIGKYIGSKSNVGPNSSMMHNVVNEDGGAITGVWGSAVLDGKFAEIPVNSRVRVEFLGKTTSKNGTAYKNYEVKFFPPQGYDPTLAPTVPAPLGGTPTTEGIDVFPSKAV